MKQTINYTYIERLISVKSIIKNDKIKEIMRKFKYIPKYYFKFIKDYHEDTENVENEDLLQKQINKFVSDEFYNIKNKLEAFYNENNIDLYVEFCKEKELKNHILKIILK